MNNTRELLNDFLVNVFHEILRIEGDCLKNGEFTNLSIREMHVIEAVCTGNTGENNNRASDIAQAQRITPGTLTITVNQLVKKGYLLRKQDEHDKRIIRLYPTQKGLSANQSHQNFHDQMVSNVMDTLTPPEIDSLIKGLESLQAFFDKNK